MDEARNIWWPLGDGRYIDKKYKLYVYRGRKKERGQDFAYSPPTDGGSGKCGQNAGRCNGEREIFRSSLGRLTARERFGVPPFERDDRSDEGELNTLPLSSMKWTRAGAVCSASVSLPLTGVACAREAISLIPVPKHVTRYFSGHVLGFSLFSPQPLSRSSHSTESSR